MREPIWNADLGNGQYQNPILYADYSDPDAIRVGDDYFMVTSSFSNTPALPILHSKDLVHWQVVNYVLKNIPFPLYDQPAHGKGVWAPAIRHHNGLFYVFYPMPDEGIFCCTTADPFGEWSEPICVRAGAGWIDPCPIWDDDGSAFMVSAFAKSRCGINSILNLAPMKPDASGLIDDGRHIFDGHKTQPTIEGPKLYKRNGYYYIFAPAGSVQTGWQTVLRSREIWGEYEERIVMMQGGTSVNGPHQGALLDTPSGEWWFLHFQDVGTCGRILHLQPVNWVEDWPVIGEAAEGEFCGRPVLTHKKPDCGTFPPVYPADSDEFEGDSLGLQWQWNANHQDDWYTLSDKKLHLTALPLGKTLYDTPHLLLQKFMAPGFEAVMKADFRALPLGAMGGLLILGGSYGALACKKTEKGLDFVKIEGTFAQEEKITTLASTEIDGSLYLKLTVDPKMNARFFYSVDGFSYLPVSLAFPVTQGNWVGAKFGCFAAGNGGTLPVEYLRVLPLSQVVK